MEDYSFSSIEEQEAHFELTEAVAAREIRESAHHSLQQPQPKITPSCSKCANGAKRCPFVEGSNQCCLTFSTV